MTTTLTNGIDTISPVAVDGYASTSRHGNIVHQILASEDVDVVLRPAGLRTGRMTLMMGDDESASAAAETALRSGTVWTLSPGGDPTTVAMQFVVVDDVTRTMDDGTRLVWLVDFGWQEVNP